MVFTGGMTDQVLVGLERSEKRWWKVLGRSFGLERAFSYVWIPVVSLLRQLSCYHTADLTRDVQGDGAHKGETGEGQQEDGEGTGV